MGIYSLGKKSPIIHQGAYVLPDTSIVGDVNLEDKSSIWFGVTLRGDIENITVGYGSNVQDNSTLHTDFGKPCIVGNYVSIGHNVVLHGCKVEDNVIVGMHSTVLNGSFIPKNTIVAAGSLLTSSSKVEEGTLIMGRPAKSVRKLTEEEVEKIKSNALLYIKKTEQYKDELMEEKDER